MLQLNASALSKRLKSSSIKVYLHLRQATLELILEECYGGKRMMGLSHSLSESPILILLLICHFFCGFSLAESRGGRQKRAGNDVFCCDIL